VKVNIKDAMGQGLGEVEINSIEELFEFSRDKEFPLIINLDYLAGGFGKENTITIYDDYIE